MTSYPLLCEINTRCWLRELTEHHGGPATLGDVPAAQFDQWRRLGFTHVWLMGVWASGPRARQVALAEARRQALDRSVLPDWQPQDIAGSPYAIGDYQVPETLGGEAGLAAFLERLHAQGLKLLLDFVPNHLGLDHPWLRQRPGVFVQSPDPRPGTFRQQTRAGPRWLAHGKDPYFPPWTDTAQLDYRRPDARAAMTGLLRSVAARCDGVRCDMAMLLLNDVFNRTWETFPALGPAPASEFWADAIATVKEALPDFLFLAEAYWGLGPRLRTLGFDYVYDKELYDRLMGRDAAGLHQHLFGLAPQDLAAGAHFLENHDEPRVASLLSLAEHRAAALVILGLPGMRFLHEGQLSGARVRVPVQLLRRPAEPVQAPIQEFYQTLLTALQASAVGHGAGLLLAPRPAWPGNPTDRNSVLVQWQARPRAFDLVAVNLAPHPSQCYVSLNVPELAASEWRFEDALSRDQFSRAGRELERQGLYLDLPAHGTALFHVEPGAQ